MPQWFADGFSEKYSSKPYEKTIPTQGVRIESESDYEPGGRRFDFLRARQHGGSVPH